MGFIDRQLQNFKNMIEAAIVEGGARGRSRV